MRQVFVGLDWAEDHHDVFVEDDTGRRLAGGRLPEGVEGMARFHELVAGHVDDPADVVVATETDRGLFIGALVAAGYTVLAVNPMSTSRYRESPWDLRRLSVLDMKESNEFTQGFESAALHAGSEGERGSPGAAAARGDG